MKFTWYLLVAKYVQSQAFECSVRSLFLTSFWPLRRHRRWFSLALPLSLSRCLCLFIRCLISRSPGDHAVCVCICLCVCVSAVSSHFLFVCAIFMRRHFIGVLCWAFVHHVYAACAPSSLATWQLGSAFSHPPFRGFSFFFFYFILLFFTVCCTLRCLSDCQCCRRRRLVSLSSFLLVFPAAPILSLPLPFSLSVRLCVTVCVCVCPAVFLYSKFINSAHPQLL